jgi:predicted RND superfamily exporter protein
MATEFEKSSPREHSHLEEVVEGRIENLVFNHRFLWLVLILSTSLFLGYHASQMRPETGFKKMIPQDHEFIENFNKHSEYVASPNVVRIIVEATGGSVFDPDYLATLQAINDEVFFLPGVDRAALKSLWTKNVQWRAVSEEGFTGGVVIGDDYDGSAASLERVRSNVLRSGEVGLLVANDFGSSVVLAPLLDFDPETGEPLDYGVMNERLETLRQKYNSDAINIRIVGFAKVVGNMIDGIGDVAIFFAIAVLFTIILLFQYSRCWRSTFSAVSCALLAIVWQLGLLRLMGFALDPFSILVPFLIFAIGVSHAVQNVNYMAMAAGAGLERKAAARSSFNAVFAPGLTALISDGVGFFTIYFIPVQIIQELAIAASVGIVALVFSKLVLLPILMSYVGISYAAINKAQQRQERSGPVGTFLVNFTRPSWARVTVVLGILLMAYSVYARQDLKIGDLDKGAPEFHPDSVYNLDMDFLVTNYASSADTMIAMVESADDACTSYETISSLDRFSRAMEGVPGVQGVASTASGSKRTAALLNEGNIRWSTVYRVPRALNGTVLYLPEGVYFNHDRCNLSFVHISLDNHKAETLTGVVAAARQAVEDYEIEGLNYLLAAGNAGIEAATNDVIASKQVFMLLLVYAVVTCMVFLTFRNLRAVVCIMVPLSITSMLCEAVMAHLGIGIKVATLPVIALGVGIGVDYGIYIYSRLEHYLLLGHDIQEAYRRTLRSAGRAVTLTGLTLSAGVMTWMLSPLKFQVDMGILLLFIFLWNMVGALTLLPALAVFLHRGEVPVTDEAGKEDLTGSSVTATLTQNRSSLDSIGETVNVTG